MAAFSTVSSCLHRIAMNISGATLRFESLLHILHKKTTLASISSWELGIPKALVQTRPSIPTLSSIYGVLILAWVIWHWILMCNPSCSAKEHYLLCSACFAESGLNYSFCQCGNWMLATLLSNPEKNNIYMPQDENKQTVQQKRHFEHCWSFFFCWTVLDESRGEEDI